MILFKGGFRPPTTGSSCTLYTSYNIRRTFLPWGFRPPPPRRAHRITSAVHFDLRYISTAGDRLFFYFTNLMFERFNTLLPF
jgi:hypothetical protein